MKILIEGNAFKNIACKTSTIFQGDKGYGTAISKERQSICETLNPQETQHKSCSWVGYEMSVSSIWEKTDHTMLE